MPIRSEQARAIFLEALEKHSPEQWPALLEQSCTGDQSLRAEVARLLAAQAELGSFHEGNRDMGATTDQFFSEGPGTIIGPYKLMEQIGEGGMGLVFVAEQHQPVRRKVAIKVIKPGMDTREVIARFEAERQALALMDHPNIAHVIDGGATDNGRPYFVMELVKGIPIIEYCDRERLTTRQRLDLFLSVCHAIQHAHSKGIIHRDLKPSNVLVAPHDGIPVVKVIDFGVAKAIGQQLTDKTIYTRFTQMIGTPLYMSPEQAEINALDVDTRSDVYSLGVLLYELLTGTTPFDRERFATVGFDEIRRIIKEEEPPKPSARLSSLAETRAEMSASRASTTLASIATSRKTEPAKLSALIQGDLDWIVMKALEKDRNRRYASPGSFAEDIERYLHNEAVLARPPSTVYRLKKFVQRNRTAVLTTGALALVVIASVGTVGAVQIKANRDRATEKADRAVREAGTSASVAEAVREARERAEDAWNLDDYPDQMQRATTAAVSALRRADGFVAAGSPPEATVVELAAAHEAIDELVRHSRLIAANSSNLQLLADETGKTTVNPVFAFCNRQSEALRQFGLDPMNDSVDTLAHAVATNRLRDSLLGILVGLQRNSAFLTFDPDGAAPVLQSNVRERLELVVRTIRQRCGGAYARWQDLLDRKDVKGLVEFATSSEGLSFRSTLVGALGRDLRDARQYAAFQSLLRAAVDRYPNDIFLHVDLCNACQNMALTGRQPHAAAYREALRHMAAASALRPESGQFHKQLGDYYAVLGSPEESIAEYRKAVALSPDSAMAYSSLGTALSKRGDHGGAIAALREAVRFAPKSQAAHVALGRMLATAGRHTEALKANLDAMRENPQWANNIDSLRSDTAEYAMNCADGKGTDPPPISERPAYRAQALELLNADLAARRRLGPRSRESVHRTMCEWLVYSSLESVRQPMELDRLPADERDAWQKFWASVRDLRDRTAPKSGVPPSNK